MPTYIWLPLSVAFLLGIAWRLFARASKAYHSKLRSYPSRWSFIATNWDVFLIRTFPWNSGWFALWLFHPDYLARLLIFNHVPASFANWMIVTPNLATSWAFGFLVDYATDQLQLRLSKKLPSWVPGAFKGEIPNYDEQVVNGQMLVQVDDRDTGRK